jgi:hypothetical protein
LLCLQLGAGAAAQIDFPWMLEIVGERDRAVVCFEPEPSLEQSIED